MSLVAEQASTDYWPQIITGAFALGAAGLVSWFNGRHQANARADDRQ
jgi:hypothetical protein